jgi:hypothetical protein
MTTSPNRTPAPAPRTTTWGRPPGTTTWGRRPGTTTWGRRAA